MLEPGDRLELSHVVTCTVVFPPADFDGRTASDKSLVLRIEDRAARVLLMSDSAYSGEHWLLDNSRDLYASVVGSAGSPRIYPAPAISSKPSIRSPPLGLRPPTPLRAVSSAVGPRASSNKV